MSSLKSARVIGFFSLPSPSLAEANPSAYASAMADAPRGAGSCSHCGMGILHHVVIRDGDGVVRFIGSDCAMKVGEESVRRSVRERLTTEQIEARDAKRQAEVDAYHAKVASNRAATLARWDAVGDLVDALIGSNLSATWRSEFLAGPAQCDGHLIANCYATSVDTNSFPAAMAAALIRGERFSPRMAECTAKCIVGRRTKKTAAAFDALFDRLCPNS